MEVPKRRGTLKRIVIRNALVDLIAGESVYFASPAPIDRPLIALTTAIVYEGDADSWFVELQPHDTQWVFLTPETLVGIRGDARKINKVASNVYVVLGEVLGKIVTNNLSNRHTLFEIDGDDGPEG